MNRRTFMTRGSGAVLGLAGGGMLLQSLAQEGNQGQGMINDATRRAIDVSLRWLAGQQVQQAGQQLDGAFGTGQYQGNVAVTSLCGLALMAGGHQPGRGLFGDQVTKAVRYILSQVQRDGQNAGFINSQRGQFHGPMYGHGFATLFLAEVYGMVNDPALRRELRDKLGMAVRLIISGQNNEGGWR